MARSRIVDECDRVGLRSGQAQAATVDKYGATAFQHPGVEVSS